MNTVIRKLNTVKDHLQYYIPQGLWNLIVYTPLIYNTREWDYAFLYDMIIFKLKRMEDSFKKETYLDNSKIIKEMNVARKALQRVRDDMYPGFRKYMSMCKNKRSKASIKLFKKDEQLKKHDLGLFSYVFYHCSRGWWS